jgi:hypothetical protein
LAIVSSSSIWIRPKPAGKNPRQNEQEDSEEDGIEQDIPDLCPGPASKVFVGGAILLTETSLTFFGQKKAVFHPAASFENPFVVGIPVALTDHIGGSKLEL